MLKTRRVQAQEETGSDTEQSSTEQSSTEQSYAEESYTEESYTEDSYIEESYTDESYVASEQEDVSFDDDGTSRTAEKAILKFLGHLEDFLRANAARVHAAYHSGCGWETWLHVELYCFITGLGETRIEREPAAYARSKRLRADLSVGFGLAKGAAWIPIEIKCETEKETAKHFGDNVNKDAKKVLDTKGPALVLGVCLSTDAKDELDTELRKTIHGGGKTVHYGYTYSTLL